jgi:hypothetical protein
MTEWEQFLNDPSPMKIWVEPVKQNGKIMLNMIRKSADEPDTEDWIDLTTRWPKEWIAQVEAEMEANG